MSAVPNALAIAETMGCGIAGCPLMSLLVFHRNKQAVGIVLNTRHSAPRSSYIATYIAKGRLAACHVKYDHFATIHTIKYCRIQCYACNAR